MSDFQGENNIWRRIEFGSCIHGGWSFAMECGRPTYNCSHGIFWRGASKREWYCLCLPFAMKSCMDKYGQYCSKSKEEKHQRRPNRKKLCGREPYTSQRKRQKYRSEALISFISMNYYVSWSEGYGAELIYFFLRRKDSIITSWSWSISSSQATNERDHRSWLHQHQIFWFLSN